MDHPSRNEEFEHRIKELERDKASLCREREDLHKEIQKYHAIFNDIEDAYYEVDLAGNFMTVNNAVCNITGYSRETLIGLNNRHYSSPETARKMFTIYNNVYMTGEPATVTDCKIITEDGVKRIVELSVALIKDSEGNAIGFRGIGREATERRKAEETLKESERRLSDIVNFLPDATFAIDIEGNIILWNRAIEELTGVSCKDMMGKGNYEYALPFYGVRKPILVDLILHADEQIEQNYSFIKRESDTLIIETSNTTIKGENTLFWAKASTIYDHHGKVIGAIETIRDITEHNQAEQALKKSEAKYRELVENANSIILRRDIEGFITYFNEYAQNFFGYDEEEVLGKNVVGTIIPETDHAGRDLTQMVRNIGRFPDKYVNNQNENMRSNGERVWVAWTNKAIYDENGTLRELLCIGNDITERKKAEVALQKEKAYFEQLFESSPEAIILVDNDGCLLRANSEFTRMFGYTTEETQGQRIDDLIVSEEHHEEAAMLTQTVVAGQRVSCETVRRRKDGSSVNVSILGTPIQGEGGQGAVYGIYRDITEQKQAEEEKKKLESELYQAQKMEAIGTLAGGIAHDFNNLLMGIQGRAALMLMDMEPSHPHYDHLTQQEEIVKSGANLTRQILGFARGGKYDIIAADITATLDKTSEMFGRAKKEIQIFKKYEADIWTVEIDQNQIEQVFVNMFINAWQAMPGGGHLYIETENVYLQEKQANTFNIRPGRYVKTSISDTGIGMDESTKQRIFEPFFTTKDRGRGTGLGLASAYGIIKNHDGVIEVASKRGAGTTFSIYLPAVNKKITGETSLKESQIIKGTEAILLVDDELIILDVGKEILKTLGYEVIIAESGSIAIERFTQFKGTIDMVILDMIMPGMGGGEVFDEIKKIRPDIKVLLSSGYSLHDRAQDILNRGCRGFIQKPFKIEQLSRKIRQILDEQE